MGFLETIRRRAHEERLKRSGWEKTEHGYWRKGPRAIEQETYEKIRRQEIIKAAIERGRERAKREIKSYRESPLSFQERMHRIEKNVGRGIEKLRSQAMKRGRRGYGKRKKDTVSDMFGISQHSIFRDNDVFEHGIFKMRKRR